MKYKCIRVLDYESWLTVENEYDGEMVVSPSEFSGGRYILIYKADDGYRAYAKSDQFVIAGKTASNLGDFSSV